MDLHRSTIGARGGEGGAGKGEAIGSLLLLPPPLLLLGWGGAVQALLLGERGSVMRW